MKRRSFIAALAGLPLVGRLFAAEKPAVGPVDYTPDVRFAEHPTMWQITATIEWDRDGIGRIKEQRVERLAYTLHTPHKP